ncbi:EamA family transporter [Vibrio sp. M60_M31a]
MGWFVASVIPATCLRFFIQIKGRSGTNQPNAALLMTLEPLWTVLISVVWLNEAMSTNKILGIVLILTALMVYRCWDLVRVKVKRLRAF